MNWSVPRMWEGQTVALLGSGVSMSAGVANAVRATKVPTVAINTTHALAPWADMIYAGDAAWWQHYGRRLRDYTGLKVTTKPEAESRLMALELTGQQGYDPDPKAVRGNNSGLQALHLAITAGATTVELYGFDMHGNKGLKHHWHGLHPLSMRNHGEDMYQEWLQAFEVMAGVVKEMGVRVVNRTPNSALRCFEMAEA